MTSVEKLQELWAAVADHGVPQETIRALVEHAQDMEADRISFVMTEVLSDSRVAKIDGDIIVKGIRDALTERSYRVR